MHSQDLAGFLNFREQTQDPVADLARLPKAHSKNTPAQEKRSLKQMQCPNVVFSRTAPVSMDVGCAALRCQ